MAELTIATSDGKPLVECGLTGRSKLTIGRSRACDLLVDHPKINRHHALLVEELGHWWIIDLCREPGVFVEDHPLRLVEAVNSRPVRFGPLFAWFYGLGEGEHDTQAPPRPARCDVILTRAEVIEALWREARESAKVQSQASAPPATDPDTEATSQPTREGAVPPCRRS